MSISKENWKLLLELYPDAIIIKVRDEYRVFLKLDYTNNSIKSVKKLIRDYKVAKVAKIMRNLGYKFKQAKTGSYYYHFGSNTIRVSNHNTTKLKHMNKYNIVVGYNTDINSVIDYITDLI